jgi:hypothetical protein
MAKLTKSGKVDKRTIKYAFLEYTGLDGKYYGGSYDETKLPALLDQLKAAGITNCCVNDELVFLADRLTK